MSESELIFISVIVLLVVLALVVVIVSKRRKRLDDIDLMDGSDFEEFCGSLLKLRGFSDVEITRKSHDYGVDILAEKDGITYAIQCKCYSAPVGIKAVQEAYAGRDYYDRMVGVVFTNQYFTTPAVEVAKKLRILLWDRGYLESMMEERKDEY